MWDTTYFRRWANACAHESVDGLYLPTEDRLIYQQVFDPAFRKTWAAYLEHRSLHPAHGPGLPLTVRLAQATGGDLPADRVFHRLPALAGDRILVFLWLGMGAGERRPGASAWRPAAVTGPVSRPVSSALRSACRRSLKRVAQLGSAHFWLAPVWQVHRWILVPSAEETPEASRHLPDCGFLSVPSV